MGLSTCAKAWIACGVCTAVVLAVMIPVTMLVIVPDVAPGMGQKALDASTMNIPKSTTVGYSDISSCPSCSTISNNVVLDQDSLPLSAKLMETDLVMHVAAGMADIFDPTTPLPAFDLGWFRMPEQTIKHGTNNFEFESNFTIFDPMKFLDFGFSFAGSPSQVISIVGQPQMSVLWGITFQLKMGKRMNCTIQDGEDAPLQTAAVPLQESEEYVAARRLQSTVIVLSCVQLGNLEESEIDAILAKFANERTTTPAPTPAPTTAPSGPNVV